MVLRHHDVGRGWVGAHGERLRQCRPLRGLGVGFVVIDLEAARARLLFRIFFFALTLYLVLVLAGLRLGLFHD